MSYTLLFFGTFILIFITIWIKSIIDERSGLKLNSLPDKEIIGFLDAWEKELSLHRLGPNSFEGERASGKFKLDVEYGPLGRGGASGYSRRGGAQALQLTILAGSIPNFGFGKARLFISTIAPLGTRPTSNIIFEERFACAGSEVNILDDVGQDLLVRGSSSSVNLDLRVLKNYAILHGEWPVNTPPKTSEVADLIDAVLYLWKRKK